MTVDLSGSGELQHPVLRALTPKLMTKGLLSTEDVRALLLEAAKGLDADDGGLTTKAAQDIVEGDLGPAFLGR